MRRPKRINKYRRYRESNDITRDEAAFLLGISVSYLQKIENDFGNPGKELMYKMSLLYKCKMEDFFLCNSTSQKEKKVI